LARFELLLAPAPLASRAGGSRRRQTSPPGPGDDLRGGFAGLAAAAAIAASGAADKAVLVDNYTRHVISDRFVHAASLLDKDSGLKIRARTICFVIFLYNGLASE